MNISQRQNGELSAIITIEIKPEDYRARVDKSIRNYSKNANIPGFRPGHVPAGIIKKRYGREVLVEELNTILGQEVYNYIRENKIDVLGSPLPIQSQTEMVFEDGKDYTFEYEIGLAPVVNVQLPASTIPFFQVKVDDKMIEEDVNDLRRRYGKFSNPEAAEKTSVLYGEFTELNEIGEVKEGGNKTTTTLSIEMIRNEEEQNKFIGTKKDEIVRFNPMKGMGNETEVSAMLRVDKKSDAMNSDYQFQVKTVNKIEKAELNQELFDKAFGEDVVHTEEEMRNKISEGIASYFEKESDRKFQKDVRNVLLESNNIQIPDEFLKRMLKSRQEKEMDEAQFDHEYFHTAEDLKWDLIQNKIAADNSLSVTQEELHQTARMVISQQFVQYGVAPPEDEKLNEMAMDYLNKEDHMERMERSVMGQKVFSHLKQSLKLDRIEIPYDEFIQKMKEKTSHEVEHHH